MAKPTKKTTKKSKAPRKTSSSLEISPVAELTTDIEDPIGDVSSGEALTYLGDESATGDLENVPATADEPATSDEIAGERSEAEQEQAELESEVADEAETEEPEFSAEPAPAAKLERLQKILSQAGIASRRRAEEMITEGRVQVNGTVVTELGSKADPARDHIRVDGKLLHGAERHRYFVLNKPKGYVTTVSDPEGRPTVMKFFEKTRERLYPVGRLDYQSEGLLLMTNDGELANQLTKAGSGVEKTYLVKVAGQPTEEELDRLRSGVAIEHGAPGSKKVHTAPARIQQVRQGDNPWYEVVLIEGRNRELRKMFSAVGHFVEKIRRVGYGPLVLDLEPGKLRELRTEEVDGLRLAAEGKLPKKAQRPQRSSQKFSGVPKKTAYSKGDKQRGPREWDRLSGGRREDRPKLEDRAATRSEGRFGNKPARAGRPPFREESRSGDRRKFGSRPDSGRDFPARSGRGSSNPPFEGRSGQDKPAWMRPSRDDQPRGGRPPFREESRSGDRRNFGGRPDSGRGFPARSGRGPSNPPREGRSGQDRPAWAGPSREDRPRGERPIAGRDRGDRRFGENRSSRTRSDEFPSNRESRNRYEDKPRFTKDRPGERADRSEGRSARPRFEKPGRDAEERRPQRPAGKSFGGRNSGGGQRGGFQSKGRPARNSSSGSRGQGRRPGNRGRSGPR